MCGGGGGGGGLQLYQRLKLILSCCVPQRKNDGSTFAEDQLVMYILDLHFAGTDTTSNTLLTAFLYLMNHPEVQGLFKKHTLILA